MNPTKTVTLPYPQSECNEKQEPEGGVKRSHFQHPTSHAHGVSVPGLRTILKELQNFVLVEASGKVRHRR
jgi:hypothetical protein